jgi:hypothetical protein
VARQRPWTPTARSLSAESAHPAGFLEAGCSASTQEPGSPSAGAGTSASTRVATTLPLPPVNGPFDYQIGGAYAPSSSVSIVDRDRGDSPAL